MPARKAAPTKLLVGREEQPIVQPQNNSAVVRVPEPMRGRVAGILVTSAKPVKIFLALCIPGVADVELFLI